MDYFPNGDFPKSYPLPGISYYMSGMPTNVPNQQGQQGILGLGTPTYDGQQYMETDFSAFQHQQYQQQPSFPPRQQYMVGQKRKATTGYQYQQASKEDETVGKDGQKVDPFAPECSIPLPYQLGDEYSYYGPTAVWKRNERERHRVRCVNDGYEKLRNHLPVPDNDKRLSKVETLRFAIRYINHLEKLLADARHDEQCDCDFTVRSASVSDSCQSPAVTTTGTGEQQHRGGGKRGKGRKYGRRRSLDETSDENEDNGRN